MPSVRIDWQGFSHYAPRHESVRAFEEFIVSREQIEGLIAKWSPPPEVKPAPAPRRSNADTHGEPLDLKAWIRDHNVPIAYSHEKDGWCIYLHTDANATCPFSPDRPANAFYVMQGPNGALKAGCHHNRCGGREQRWPDIRAMFDPREARTKGAAASDNNGKQGNANEPDLEAVRAQITALLKEAKATDTLKVLAPDFIAAAAALREHDAPEYERLKRRLKTEHYLSSLAEFDRLVREGAARRKADTKAAKKATAAVNPASPGGDYFETAEGLFLHTELGARRLTNFIAAIVADIVVDDGAETARHTELVARLGRHESEYDLGQGLRCHALGAASGSGSKATIYPGKYAVEHCATAIRELSNKVITKRRYGHTGWRKVDSELLYLHAGGAIGANGAGTTVEVALPEPLTPLSLPVVPDDDGLKAAVRATARLSLELHHRESGYHCKVPPSGRSSVSRTSPFLSSATPGCSKPKPPP